jgi:hypothetical protein
LSEEALGENADSRSSFDSIEKDAKNSASVTMPMVRVSSGPLVSSAQLTTLRVPTRVSRPT